MYGRTNNSQTFMTRTANHSTKGSRRGFVDVATKVTAADVQTAAEKRDNLKRRHAALSCQRDEVKKARGGKDEWRRIGLEMFDIQQQISDLNKITARRASRDFPDAFVACAKLMLPPADYERIAESARRKLVEEGATP